jgi:transposase
MLRSKRPNFPQEYRGAIVQMTLKPGASTSLVARENGLNVDIVFNWRQRFKKDC